MKIFLHSGSPSETLHSNFFLKTLILAFEANSALSCQNGFFLHFSSLCTLKHQKTKVPGIKTFSAIVFSARSIELFYCSLVYYLQKKFQLYFIWFAYKNFYSCLFTKHIMLCNNQTIHIMKNLFCSKNFSYIDDHLTCL